MEKLKMNQFEPEEPRSPEVDAAIDRMLDRMKDESYSTLTAVEHNVVLGLILQVKKDIGEYNLEFLTTVQDSLVLVGFPAIQVMEIMTQYLNPESKRFESAEVQHALQQEFYDAHEYN
jgi:hypothetical protein